MKPSFILIAPLALLWGPFLNAQGSFALDGGVRWQQITYNEGQSSAQYLGPQLGVSRRLGVHFEAHMDLAMFLWATEPQFNSFESFWVKPGQKDYLRHNKPLAFQSTFQIRWRPQGFQKGLYTGLGAGFFSDVYAIAYDHLQRPYLLYTLGTWTVFQAVTGYQIPVGKKHSIQLTSSMEGLVSFGSKKNYLMGSFGVGWRWAR